MSAELLAALRLSVKYRGAVNVGGSLSERESPFVAEMLVRLVLLGLRPRR